MNGLPLTQISPLTHTVGTALADQVEQVSQYLQVFLCYCQGISFLKLQYVKLHSYY